MKSRFLRTALESERESNKRLAIIIKGNPKYLNNPKTKPRANAFYKEIADILRTKGYAVEFDPGEPYTQPHAGATVWIAHSRGIDRLRFAPKGVITIALKTMDYGKTYRNHDEHGADPDHYKLSPADKKAFDQLP